MWLNENAGVVVLILGILAVAMLAVALWLLFSLNSRFAAQRLKFTGFSAMDVNTRAVYAALTVGNRSVSEIALKEIGIKNGNVAFDLTALYKRKTGMGERAYIVIEQRRSIGFRLEQEELGMLFPEAGQGGRLKTLRLYALDLTGNVYEGRIPAVKKMLASLSSGGAAFKKPAVPAIPQPPVREPEVPRAPASEPLPEEGEKEYSAAHAGEIPYDLSSED